MRSWRNLGPDNASLAHALRALTLPVALAAFQRADERLADQGFIVLAVDWTQADDRDQIIPFVEELGLTFPVLLDPDSAVVEDRYRVRGLPTSVFIGRDGVIREIFIGALPLEWLEEKQESRFET